MAQARSTPRTHGLAMAHKHSTPLPTTTAHSTTASSIGPALAAALARGYQSDLPFLIDIANAARRIAFAQRPAEPTHDTAIDAGRMVHNKDDRARETGPSDTPPHQEDSLYRIQMPSRNYFRSGGF